MLWMFWACSTPSPLPAQPTPEQAEAPLTAEEVADPARTVATDVVIVGGGLAGLSAGMAAIENGAEVIILERSSEPGGSARWASTILFAGTATQRAAEVEDSPAALLAAWSELTGGGDADSPWVRRFAEQGPVLHDWLTARGVGFRLGPASEDGEVPRKHGIEGGGQAVVDTVLEELPEGVLWTGYEVLGLDPRPEGGALVEALGPDGETVFFDAPAVVMATGGFLRDMQLVAEVVPGLDPAAVWHSSGTWADGSGHRMLQEIGGHWQNRDAINILAHGIPHPRPERPGHELLLNRLSDAVWVNLDGARFTDESRNLLPEAGDDLLAQPGHVGWAIFDADTPLELEGQLMDVMATGEHRSIDDIQLEDLIEAGHAAEAPDLETLALELEVDADGLLQTAEDMEQRWREGEADPWQGRRLHGLDHGPFVAVRVVPALGKAFGGMAVDTQGQVLGPDGDALVGIFAAGELTGMAGGTLVGERPFAGSLSAVMLSGLVAGESAALH